MPVPECDLRRSPGTVGPGPPSPGWVLAGAARGCLGWGQRWFSLGKEEGRKGARPAALKLCRYPALPCSGSGLGRAGLCRGGQGGSKYSIVLGRFQKKKKKKNYSERCSARAGPGERSAGVWHGAEWKQRCLFFMFCSGGEIFVLFSLPVC